MTIKKTQQQVLDLFQQYFAMRDGNSIFFEINRSKLNIFATTNMPRYDTAHKSLSTVYEKYLVPDGDKKWKTELSGNLNEKGEVPQLVIQEGKTRADFEKEHGEVLNKIVAIEV